MIGKTITGVIVLVVIYTILRANGFQPSELLTHIGQFLEYGADTLMQLWQWVAQFFSPDEQGS